MKADSKSDIKNEVDHGASTPFPISEASRKGVRKPTIVQVG